MKHTTKVVGKDELIHQVAASAGFNLKDTTSAIEAFTAVVRDRLSDGHAVRLMGFGTWEVREVASRKVLSIRSGRRITIPAKKRVGFSVGAVLGTAATNHKTP